MTKLPYEVLQQAGAAFMNTAGEWAIGMQEALAVIEAAGYTIEPGWRPIEEAPLDRKDLLIHNNIAPGSPSGKAEDCWAGNTAVAARWGDEENGRWICYMDQVQDPEACFKPTHFKPLPAPPEDA